MIKHISHWLLVFVFVGLGNSLFGQAESTVTDSEGNVYKTVVIGGQEWMGENLRASKYRNGEGILSNQPSNQWRTGTEGIWANFDNNPVNDGLYGKLYNWYATVDPRGLCPAGWRVPTDNDWQILVDFVDAKTWGNSNKAGQKLKSRRQVDSPLGGEFNTTEHPRWDSHSNRFGTDDFGFSALPGGYYAMADAFVHNGEWAYFWSVTENKDGNIWVRTFKSSNRGISKSHYNKTVGLSVRCIKADEPEAQVPQLNTIQPLNITTSSAMLGGEIFIDGGSPITTRGIVWGTDENPTLETNLGEVEIGSGLGRFTETITDLIPGTTYWIRAFATNNEGTAYGIQKMLDIPSTQSVPVITTRTVSAIAENSATVGGNITSGGGAQVTVRGVVWSVNENPTIDNNDGITDNGEGMGIFYSTIEGLIHKTTYYVRAYATNSEGTAYGNQIHFTTLTGVDLDHGLVAWYPFNGDANDESGLSNHANVNGATLTRDRFGVANSAYLFNGAEWIEALHQPAINFGISDEYSLSLWVAVSPENTSSGVIEKWIDGATPYPYVVRVIEDKVQAARYIGGYPQDQARVHYATTDVIDASVFHHVAVVFKPTTISLYIDGMLVETTESHLVDGNVSNNHKLFIGRRGGSTTRFFKGVIDDIRIYSRPLLQKEIVALYNEEGPDIPHYTLIQTASPVDAGVVQGAGEYKEGEEIAISATPAEGYQFVNWTKGVDVVSTNANFTYIMPGEEVNLIANFEALPPTLYSLSITVNPVGSGEALGAGEYEAGDEVALSATAAEGFQLVNWTIGGDVVSTNASFTYTMPGEEVNLIANFEALPPTLYRLSITVNPVGSGEALGVGEYEAGDEVALSATAADGFQFVNWTKGGDVLSPDASFTYTMLGEEVNLIANFEALPPTLFRLSITVNPIGSGEALGAGEYESGDEVALSATAADGFQFVSWTKGGDVLSPDASFTYTMLGEEVNLIANFEALPPTLYSLSITVNPIGSGEALGAGEYEAGDEVALSATAAEGFQFVNWTKGGDVLSPDASFTYTMPGEEVSLVANFKVKTDNVNRIIILDASANANGTIQIKVEMKNLEPIISFQMDFALPAGFTYVQDSFSLSGRSQGHYSDQSVLPGNVLRVLAFSIDDSVFSGNSGLLFSFSLNAPSENGTYQLDVVNVNLTNAHYANVFDESQSGTLTIN